MKKIVDERQEREMLKIEHIGFWIMFWSLFGSIIIQTILYPADFKRITGEIIVFLIGCIVTLICCFRKGFWDYYSEPSIKNYFLYSIAFAILIWIIQAITLYKNIDDLKNNISQLIISSGLSAVVMFPVFFILLFISGTIVKKRRKKLEKDVEDDDM